MKLKRKLLAVITAAATVLSLCACSSESGYSNSDSGKLKIISTVFPPYDLARQIAGDNAEISILLPPGSEIHNYEPSAKDMIAIRNCDIFLYIGGENEQWAEKLINSNDTENVTAVKLIDYVPTLSEDEDEHDHDHDHDHEHEHEHETDEHIWTSPKTLSLCFRRYMTQSARLTRRVNRPTQKTRTPTQNSFPTLIMLTGRRLTMQRTRR